jgi:2-oxoglutarate ferredoxin oxidoreductase subunit alpha
MAVPPEAAGQAAESHGSATSALKPHLKRDHVVIRFAGDSGDGMQLTGMQFTAESALAGNDIATLPDFPAEIRAPQGTLAGVSGFQLNFSSSEIFTAGDEPNVLVAMNPAALQANIEDVPPNAVIIVDRDRSRCDQAHLARCPWDGPEQSRGLPMPQHVRAWDAFLAVSAAD